jgi:hypothetical protein
VIGGVVAVLPHAVSHAGVITGGQRSVLGMMLLAAAADTAAPLMSGSTIAVTLSLTSVFAVGTLLFKAGEWRGEHNALKQRVDGVKEDMSVNYKDLKALIDQRFGELHSDIRDMRANR